MINAVWRVYFTTVLWVLLLCNYINSMRNDDKESRAVCRCPCRPVSMWDSWWAAGLAVLCWSCTGRCSAQGVTFSTPTATTTARPWPASSVAARRWRCRKTRRTRWRGASSSSAAAWVALCRGQSGQGESFGGPLGGTWTRCGFQVGVLWRKRWSLLELYGGHNVCREKLKVGLVSDVHYCSKVWGHWPLNFTLL